MKSSNTLSSKSFKKTKFKQSSSSSNNFSEKYLNLTKDKPFNQTPKKISNISKELVSPRIPQTASGNHKRLSSPYTQKNQKININMDIKNFNIFNSHNQGNNTSQEPNLKKKKLHKKTVSCLNAQNQKESTQELNTITSKISQKENTNKGKKMHKKAKSQENLKSTTKEWGQLLAQYGNKNEKDEDVVTKFAICNRCGFCPEKKNKINQDAYIIIENYMKKGRYMFGVCDGHGVNGHHVSEFIKEILPENIQYYFLRNKNFNKPVKVSVESSIKEAFHKTSKDLLESGIDTMFSGTTACLVYIHKNQLYCANLGDSRAVMFSRISAEPNELEEWVYSQLSTDHKAEDKREALRIQMNGGRVFPYRDEDGEQMGPIRVWIKEQNIPGLAMTRSFGDYIASTVGVIDEPEILHHTITQQNKYMVIASDGLWQFIKHEEVAHIMTEAFMRNDPQSGVKDLQKAAVDAWQRQDDSIDDITIIVVFFKYY